jgi:hypothetical protein
MNNQTANWTRKPRIQKTRKENPYQIYGFSQNPFPDKASIVIGSDEDLPYLPGLRAKEEEKFEELMIPHPDHPHPQSIGFLMDYATRRGRGIGKTVFLNWQRERIMDDFGDSLTDSTHVLFAIHVTPVPGRTRKFWHFTQLIAETLNEQEVIAKALWRLRFFSGIVPEEILEQTISSPADTIGNDAWLRSQGVDVDFKLAHHIQRQLEQAGIRSDVAKSLALLGHDPTMWNGRFLAQQSDYRWRNEGAKLVFDDLIHLFTLAGFTRGLILVDEVEKIVTKQNIKERRTFVELLRYYFVDGPCENTRQDFYGLFLTIHPYLQELLAPHWETAGLDRFAPLSREFAENCTVYFEPLQRDSAVPLVQVYLDDARIDDCSKGALNPLDEPAVEEALALSGGVPGKMLKLLYEVMERAIKKQWDSISADRVRRVAQALPPEMPEEEIDTQQLPPAEADLTGKG